MGFITKKKMKKKKYEKIIKQMLSYLNKLFFENNEENIKQIPVKLLSRKLFEIIK